MRSHSANDVFLARKPFTNSPVSRSCRRWYGSGFRSFASEIDTLEQKDTPLPIHSRISLGSVALISEGTQLDDGEGIFVVVVIRHFGGSPRQETSQTRGKYANPRGGYLPKELRNLFFPS